MVVFDKIIPLENRILIEREYVRRGYESLPSSHILYSDGTVEEVNKDLPYLYITISISDFAASTIFHVKNIITKKFGSNCKLEDLITSEEFNIRNVYYEKKKNTINKPFPDFYWLKDQIVRTTINVNVNANSSNKVELKADKEVVKEEPSSSEKSKETETTEAPKASESNKPAKETK